MRSCSRTRVSLNRRRRGYVCSLANWSPSSNAKCTLSIPFRRSLTSAADGFSYPLGYGPLSGDGRRIFFTSTARFFLKPIRAPTGVTVAQDSMHATSTRKSCGLGRSTKRIPHSTCRVCLTEVVSTSSPWITPGDTLPSRARVVTGDMYAILSTSQTDVPPVGCPGGVASLS